MSAASPAKPIGSTLVEILKIPMEIAQVSADAIQESIPELQGQIKDLPSIFRENVRYGIKKFQETPDQLRQGFNSEKGNNIPLFLTQVASPLPMMSREQIAEAEKTAKQQLSIAPDAIEEAAKKFARQIVMMNKDAK